MENKQAVELEVSEAELTVESSNKEVKVEAVQQSTQPVALNQYDKELKTYLLISYALSIFGGAILIGYFVAFIMAVVKKKEARQKNAFMADHLNNITRTFWIGLVIGIVSLVLSVIGIGIVTAILGGAWVLYRYIKGVLRVIADKGYYGDGIKTQP